MILDCLQKQYAHLNTESLLQASQLILIGLHIVSLLAWSLSQLQIPSNHKVANGSKMTTNVTSS